jgi:hypothetical protein
MTVGLCLPCASKCTNISTTGALQLVVSYRENVNSNNPESETEKIDQDFFSI